MASSTACCTHTSCTVEANKVNPTNDFVKANKVNSSTDFVRRGKEGEGEMRSLSAKLRGARWV